MDETRELRVYVRAISVNGKTFIAKDDVLTFMLSQVNLCRRAEEDPGTVAVVESMMATLDEIRA